MKITWTGFRQTARACCYFVVLISSVIAAQTPPMGNISGRWEVEGVNAGPWIFDLAESGGVITGRVSQHGSLVGPAAIYDGEAKGSMVTFKIRNPVITGVTKEITFTGRVADSEIAFDRTMEILQTGAADNPGAFEMGAFGALTAPRFVAHRTGPVPLPPTQLHPVAQTVDVTGRWDSLQWNLDTWVLDLKSSGTKVTGSVRVIAGTADRERLNANSSPITDGKIEGNTVSFKAKSPDNVRTITFVGRAQGDEIVFSRGVELPSGGAVGFNVPMGVYAPMSFVARRTASDSRPPVAVASDIAAARKKWADRPFKRYEFSAQWTCICELPPQAFTYQVRGSNGAAQISPSVGALIGIPAQGIQSAVERYNTIDQLFDWIEKQAATHPFTLKIEYDSTLGYPLSVDLLPVGIAIDGSIQLRISGVKALN